MHKLLCPALTGLVLTIALVCRHFESCPIDPVCLRHTSVYLFFGLEGCKRAIFFTRLIVSHICVHATRRLLRASYHCFGSFPPTFKADIASWCLFTVALKLTFPRVFDILTIVCHIVILFVERFLVQVMYAAFLN